MVHVQSALSARFRVQPSPDPILAHNRTYSTFLYLYLSILFYPRSTLALNRPVGLRWCGSTSPRLSPFRGPIQCSRPAPNESARPAQVQLSAHGRNCFSPRPSPSGLHPPLARLDRVQVLHDGPFSSAYLSRRVRVFRSIKIHESSPVPICFFYTSSSPGALALRPYKTSLHPVAQSPSCSSPPGA
jgi:hypothetical protein